MRGGKSAFAHVDKTAGESHKRPERAAAGRVGFDSGSDIHCRPALPSVDQQR